MSFIEAYNSFLSRCAKTNRI